MSRKKNQDSIPNTRMNSESEKYVEITEEPLSDGTRFRYENEGRSAGRIKGANYTEKCKTYPTIKIHGYHGKAYVVVSLLTNEPPYYPHPHKLIGSYCTYGVCSKEIDNSQMTCRFTDLRIQCVKRKDVKASLELREKYRVDPFGTGFAHATDINKITFDAVKLCFQVFLPDENGKYRIPLPPVTSSPIYDSKTGSDLAIMKLSHCTAPVSGEQEVILLCGQINKNDIQIIFEEKKGKKIIWTDNGKFFSHDVHRKCAISFKTPPYKDPSIRENVSCYIYLRRPSDNSIGKRREFTLLPLKEHKRPKLDLRKVIEQENLPLEHFVDKNSRPRIRAVRIGAKHENCAEKQFNLNYIPGRVFKSPDTVNVRGSENYVKNVLFCKYQNTVSTAGDMSTVVSPYTQERFEDVCLAYTPPIQLNTAKRFGDSLSTVDHMYTVVSPYTQEQFEDVYLADNSPNQINNAESIGDSPPTADHMYTVISPHTHEQFEHLYLVDIPQIQLNNAENFGDSPSTADHMSTVFSPYAPQLHENVVFSNSPQLPLRNSGTFRGFSEDSPPNKINNSNLESNPNDTATMSGLSITSNAEMDLLNYIGAFKDRKTADESPPFHDNLKDNAVEIHTDRSLEVLSSLNLNSNSSDLDTNMSRLTIDSISESVAISILGDSYDMKIADQRMSF